MSTTEPQLTAISRTVLSLAAEVVQTVERVVVGDARVRTARGNAWEAVCADRARAERRAALSREVAALAAGHPRVGSADGRAVN